ncbi:MAG: methylaspartate mutase [Pseudomonadales bacterium]|nr:methylaspartate mutase [Pseudomonadales bacterium]
MKLRDPFNDYILAQSLKQGLVVQPRMGFSDMKEMRQGLMAVKNIGVPAVGTITVDAMTRQGLVEKAALAVRNGERLNGYPLASYSKRENNMLLGGIASDDFLVQVRHGTPIPQHVFDAAKAADLLAIEGGPVSYALPYGRAYLKDTFPAWREALRDWAKYGAKQGIATHMESFAGCMMGQMCPPSMLIALGILEGCFIKEQGVRSISLSLAQGTNSDQDIAALNALNAMIDDYLSDVSTHIVAYTWMGVFPDTSPGAEALIKESARVAVVGGAHRLIVKTVNEAFGIPSVESNLQALSWCSKVAQENQNVAMTTTQLELSDAIYIESKGIVDAILGLDESLEVSIQKGFQKGMLDVPFCLHPDNANVARAQVNNEGMLEWTMSGAVPVSVSLQKVNKLTSGGLLDSLHYNRKRYNESATLPA